MHTRQENDSKQQQRQTNFVLTLHSQEKNKMKEIVKKGKSFRKLKKNNCEREKIKESVHEYSFKSG